MSIKIENVEVVGWEHAIRGMRNPKNSWNMSDSYIPDCRHDCDKCDEVDCLNTPRCDGSIVLGNSDYNLMMRLRHAGTDHRKFMRTIVVYLDITAPMYWWKEFDTYKVGTVRNSCSTMHKIHAKEFTLEDFSCENLIGGDYDILNDEPIHGKFENTGLVLVANNDNGWLGHCYHTASGNKCVEYLNPKTMLDRYIITALNACREAYLKTKDKEYWWQMIQLLPSSYNQKSTVMLSYEVLANMYKSRKNHKLDCWRDFCKWIESLPYSEIITGKKSNNGEPEEF